MARGASYYYFQLKIHYAWDEDDVVLFPDHAIFDCTRLQFLSIVHTRPFFGVRPIIVRVCTKKSVIYINDKYHDKYHDIFMRKNHDIYQHKYQN